MPDWRRNVLSTSEAFIDALQKGCLEDETTVALEPVAASYPRRSDRLRMPATCPYTTIFLGTGGDRKRDVIAPPPPPCADGSDLYADAYSVDRSSNLTDTSSFANYEDRRDPGEDSLELEEVIRVNTAERVTLQIQKVPHTASVFYVSARSDFRREEPVPASEVYLVDADSDTLSSCTCDSFERCEFNCKDYEPFSDTCCCDPFADGGCSRSPGDVDSPEKFIDRWPDDDGLSTRSDMEGLDLALFEPARGHYETQQTHRSPEPPASPASTTVPEQHPNSARIDINNALCGVLYAVPVTNESVSLPVKGGAPPAWEPYYCVLLQDRRTLTAYSSEELANTKSGEYASRSLPRVRLDGGSTGAGAGGVRLRCWAAPPSITEEDVEDDPEADTTSLRALSVVGEFLHLL